MTAEEAWLKHKQWSAVASRLKRRLVAARWAVLLLGVAGAALQTLASQIDPQVSGSWRQNTVFLGVICFAAAAGISKKLLSKSRRRNWVRARSASEAIKTEVYLLWTGAAPYGDSGRAEQELTEAVRRVEDDMQEIMRELLRINVSSAPTPDCTAENYVDKRLLTAPHGQIPWYQNKARGNDRLATRFRYIELALTLAAAVLSIAASQYGEQYDWQAFSVTLNVTLGAWVAVLTTVSASIAAHVGVSRYDHLATSYLATSRRLQDLVQHAPPAPRGPDPSARAAWSDFVLACEGAMSIENQGWMAKWNEHDD